MQLEWIRALPVDGLTKGVTARAGPLRQDDVGRQGWNILREDLPFPVAVLRRAAVESNRAWMRAFTAAAGVSLAPHGKTTMAPEIFALQMADGAFGLTCATAGHLEVYRAVGVPRVIMANQLVGRENVRMALAHLRDPAFELYCLADSVPGLDALATAATELGLQRPVQVLVEIGAAGARTGVRTQAEAIALARAVTERASLRLAGVETYEGVFPDDGATPQVELVQSLLDSTAEAVAEIIALAPQDGAPFLVTAGGSDYFDLVAERFGRLGGPRPIEVVLRSGCYITHDSLHYARCAERLLKRSPAAARLPGALVPALEVWGVVQSRPEPGRAYVSLGKRDISYDWELPVPVKWFRPGRDAKPVPPPAEWRTLKLNDQHLHLEVASGDGPAIGDLMGFGVSHPCTTFDKWRLILVVDDDYGVVDAVRTFF